MHGEALDDRTLRRIIALLIALAALTERAAGRFFPVRWLVLCVLRRAEVVGRDFVIETAPWAWPYLEDALDAGSSPMDAVLLGQRLRMLAAVLRALLTPDDSLDGWMSGRDTARRSPASFACRLLFTPDCRRPALHDTS